MVGLLGWGGVDGHSGWRWGPHSGEILLSTSLCYALGKAIMVMSLHPCYISHLYDDLKGRFVSKHGFGLVLSRFTRLHAS